MIFRRVRRPLRGDDLRPQRENAPAMISYAVFRGRIERERRGKDALIVGLGLSVALNWALAVYIYTCLSH